MCFWILSGQTVTAGVWPDVPLETASRQMTARGGFKWTSGYDIGMKDDTVQVLVRIQLVPENGIKKVALDQVKGKWRSGVQEIWNRKFSIKTPEKGRIPIVMDVDFKGPEFHHHVIVKTGGRCCSDQLNWHILDPPIVIAHEFGHMLGAFDEYANGAVDPKTGLLDATSIMTSRPEQAKVYPRHLAGILEWFKLKTGAENAVLQVEN